MSLVERINQDIKASMLARETVRLEARRAIKAAILLALTEKGHQGALSPEEEVRLLQKLIRQREESAEIYKSQNRTDLYQREAEEAEVIKSYLPRQMDEDELKVEIGKIIAETGASSIKDMGKVMGVATKRLAGKADGRMISEVVKSILSS